MAMLGVPSEYEAVLVDSATQLPLLYLPWSTISWQRLRNGISVGHVEVSEADGGIECCYPIDGLRGWTMMLRIERDGIIVWDGPVTGWSSPRGTSNLRINAHDRFLLIQKRLVNVYRSFVEGYTPGQIIWRLATDGDIGDTTFDPYPITLGLPPAGAEHIQREYFVERGERIFDCIEEVVRATTTGFYTCAVGNVYFDEPAIREALGLSGTGKALRLNEESTIGVPGLDVSALDQITVARAGGAGQGANGFPLIATVSAGGVFIDAVLEAFAGEARSATDADLTVIAGRLLADNLGPQLTLEQVQLAPNWGGPRLAADLSNLLPGVQFDLDYESTCAFAVPIGEYRESGGNPGYEYASSIAAVRLDQLDVNVSRGDGTGIAEEVLASCRPIITGDVD